MAEDPEQPWRLQANEHRDAKLEAELSALKDASAAEAQAAAREKAVGSETLQKADEETHQATKFMTRAERLLASEQALKDEQEKVQEKLSALESEHQNIHGWAACSGQGCRAANRDEWAVSEDSPLAPSAATHLAERGRDGSSEQRRQEVMQRLKHHSKKSKHGKHGKKHKHEDKPVEKAFDPGPQGKPYSMDGWVDTKPEVNWAKLKQGAMKAGYDLTNCMVAAEKDDSTVEVRVMRMGKAVVTKKGCTCLSPWSVYKEHGASKGHMQESQELTTYGGDSSKQLCSKNGSSKSWCAVWGDDCGTLSTDPHAGHGEGQYGWTHWDYCNTKKKRWHWLDKWEDVHSAAEVTCVADFLLASDRAAEWRALELLRQEEAAGPADELPPAEVASRYTKCITRAARGASAVFCEADLLRHFKPSVVRHAVLISRSRDVDVHWLNRQRVVLLYAEQLEQCMAKASGAKEGVVCIAQMLSSLPQKPSQLAVENAMDAEEAGEAPEEVPQLCARLVKCVKDATDDDAIAFCVSNFLAMAPTKTVEAAAHLAHRTRSYGTAGFTDIKGDSNVGWEGFKDNEQSHGKRLWSQVDAK
eukprot:CAMPEP_0177733494 /NCGR_PEP_ID=MMETSP0484_2-20121128/23712_1 /TAXON_ID=354590 /ORGANISM="Rhodomonas lens, Strain RHODO" /LENGTH=585 /DNA_ID=CAMNT_0019246873 /DNA_START=52 /DNA_END=1809 /DNA_ORIENTATION=-